MDKNVTRKAERDYANGLGKVPEQDRDRWTYVGVICRPWRDAKKFARSKSELREFRDVCALNVDNIEAWLEEAPQTTIWLRELLGKPVDGVQTVSSWWARWLDSTEVPLDGEIVLAGRGQQVEDFLRACETQEVVTVGGDVRREEIVAFIAAALHETSDSQAGSGLGEVLYVNEPATARRLLGSPGGVTVVLSSEDLYRRATCGGGSDLVIVPIPRSKQVNVVLPAVDPRAVAERLEALCERHSAAWDLGALARRSLLALRRHYARKPGLFRPGWVRDGARMALRRGLLLNRWNQTRPGDRNVVEGFFGQPYATVEEDLRRFADGVDDPPFALVADQWHVVSAADTWDMVGSQITYDDIDAFAAAAVDVLADPDPLLSMSTGKRLLAMMEGVGPRCSSDLARGIATTLAIIGSTDTQIDGASKRSSDIARDIAYKLVEAANSDLSFATWASLAPSLPLLAEASPDALLDGMDIGLSGNPPLLAAMFSPEPLDTLSFDPPEPCVYFLEALKVLAWSPHHLGRVVAILGTLSELDPRRPSRAGSALADIMFPPRPNTAASVESRLDAIRSLRRGAEAAAWQVMLSMLPTAHMSSAVHPGPRYRDWEYRATAATHDEREDVIRSTASILVEDAGTDPARWISLVETVGRVPFNAGPQLVRELIENMVKGLGRFVDAHADEATRSQIWSALRAVVAHHREFSDTPWAYSESVLGLLDPLVERLTPRDLNARYRWLFTSEPIELGDGSLDAYDRDAYGRDAYDQELLSRRVKAVEAIREAGGWQALVDFTNLVQAPEFVGDALAQAGNDQTNQLVLQVLTDDSKPLTYMASQYFRKRFEHAGWEWVDRLIQTTDPAPCATAILLCATGDPPLAWMRADRLGDIVADEYWTRIRLFGFDLNIQQVEQAVHRLQTVSRHGSALALLSRYSRQHKQDPGFAELVADALEAAKDQDFGEQPELRQWDFERLLQVVSDHADDLGMERVALLEWCYMPTLGHDPDPTTLHKLLADDPEFFIQVIKLIYSPATPPSDKPSKPTEQDCAVASNAEKLLASWRGGPGLDAEGQADSCLLRAWVRRARHGLANADRINAGDDAIGEALASSPAEPDGTWPSRPVRELLEDLQSERLERGFERCIYNSRGVVTRSVEAGGEPERHLADHYRSLSKRYSAGWPRTAAIFSRLADTLQTEATGQDQATERRRRGLDH